MTFQNNKDNIDINPVAMLWPYLRRQTQDHRPQPLELLECLISGLVELTIEKLIPSSLVLLGEEKFAKYIDLGQL
jgi:hypothetical protein